MLCWKDSLYYFVSLDAVFLPSPRIKINLCLDFTFNKNRLIQIGEWLFQSLVKIWPYVQG